MRTGTEEERSRNSNRGKNQCGTKLKTKQSTGMGKSPLHMEGKSAGGWWHVSAMMKEAGNKEGSQEKKENAQEKIEYHGKQTVMDPEQTGGGAKQEGRGTG